MLDVIILATGEELLQGTTVDTNSSCISNLFYGTNFNIKAHIVVGDDIESISEALDIALRRADIVITTGGLGPTDDDNTVDAVCRLAECSSVSDNASAEKIVSFFNSMKIPVNIKDSKMCLVPADSHVLKNTVGLAPGFVMNINKKLVISLPGVPAELNRMMETQVIPYLEKNFGFNQGMKLDYLMTGIRESEINSMINNLKLPGNPNFGITSKSGLCNLTFARLDNVELKNNLDSIIKEQFKTYIIPKPFLSPEEELISLLKKNNLSISTAESCTGGLIAKRLTDIPGSSAVFKGSIIAYSNEIKVKYLNISEKLLNDPGAVSEQVAGAMAVEIRALYNSDIGVSTTGIAGPDGGSKRKPVGTVCFGFTMNNFCHTITRYIPGDRRRVRTFSCLYVVNYLRNLLINEKIQQ